MKALPRTSPGMTFSLMVLLAASTLSLPLLRVLPLNYPLGGLRTQTVSSKTEELSKKRGLQTAFSKAQRGF